MKFREPDEKFRQGFKNILDEKGGDDANRALDLMKPSTCWCSYVEFLSI